MSAKVFFDTNVLVYAYDQRDPGKQTQAQDLLLNATQAQRAQVLGEFFVVVTRKIAKPMTAAETAEVIAERSDRSHAAGLFACPARDRHTTRIPHLVLGLAHYLRRRTRRMCDCLLRRPQQRSVVSRRRSSKPIPAIGGHLNSLLLTCLYDAKPCNLFAWEGVRSSNFLTLSNSMFVFRPEGAALCQPRPTAWVTVTQTPDSPNGATLVGWKLVPPLRG